MTGLGNYSRFVIDSLAQHYPDHSYVVYSPRIGANPRIDAVLQRNGGRVSLQGPRTALWRRLGSLWRTRAICADLLRDGIGIFHGLSGELPMGISRLQGVRSVVTINDIIFRHLPRHYHFIDRHIYDYKFRHACHEADLIIAVSECTKRDVVSFYGVEPDKVRVIYQGCDEAFARPIDAALKAEGRGLYRLPQRFVLQVGTIEARKNALLSLKALRHMPADVHLVLVGRTTAYADTVARYADAHGLAGRLHVLHYVPFEHLPAIYACADAFAYPSEYEGFGIPIIEAINAGLPVVAATGSCLEEAGGPAQLYVPPTDDEAMAQALLQALDPDRRRQMVAEGRAYVARFAPDSAARQVMECYEELMRTRAR